MVDQLKSQWFLNLDGIKSGPYEPHEIVSLLTEGEVLPHHQISTQLNGTTWVSLLEWRLNQAKLLDPIPSEEQIVLQSQRDERAPWPTTKLDPPIKKSIAHEPAQPQTPPPNLPSSVGTQSTSPPTDPPKKRDPMAEMFDMLQNTKQKREARSISDARAQEQATHNSKPANGFQALLSTRFLVGLLGITLVGFIFGQWMQSSSTKDSGTKDTSATISTATPTTAPLTDATPTPPPVEKTIGSVVIKKIDPPSPPPSPPPAPKHANETPPSDIQELKKELQELKSLREEIKRGLVPEDQPATPGGMPPEFVEPSVVDPSVPPNSGIGDPSLTDPHAGDPALHY